MCKLIFNNDAFSMAERDKRPILTTYLQSSGSTVEDVCKKEELGRLHQETYVKAHINACLEAREAARYGKVDGGFNIDDGFNIDEGFSSPLQLFSPLRSLTVSTHPMAASLPSRVACIS